MVTSTIIFICLIAIAGLLRLKKSANFLEITTGTLYVFSLFIFAFGMMIHSNPYYRAIDTVNMECYSPFSDRHYLTIIFYFLTFNTSILLIWVKGRKLPPLTLVLSLIFTFVWIIISVAILFQISIHNTETLDSYNSEVEQTLFLFAPIFSILIGGRLLFKVMVKEIRGTIERTYSNRFLSFLNAFLLTKSGNPLWILVFMFPVLFLSTLILILFGQDTNSIIKVFTDTATWKFSQQTHPPILDHQGHYLCTVAASGHPKVVKPLRIGLRNGDRIIVNRQLLIANAFEEMIQDMSPKFHFRIRVLYDKYGYNLSKRINTTFLSSLTYLLMKPMEWFFLICLYLFCINPEQKINRQYAE